MCLHFEWCHLWRDILNCARGDDWMSVSKSIPTPRNVYQCMLFSSYLPDMPNMCMSQAVWRLLSPKIVLALDQCFYSQLFLILFAAAAEYARMILNLVVRLCSRIMSYLVFWWLDKCPQFVWRVLHTTQRSKRSKNPLKTGTCLECL